MLVLLPRALLACRILHHLTTCPNGIATRAEVAKAVSAPFPYTGKIIYELRQAGFIKSVRGTNGGYALALPASVIRVGDITEFIEDKRAWRTKADTDAILLDVVSEARQKFINVLNECSMADLCEEGGRLHAEKRAFAVSTAVPSRPVSHDNSKFVASAETV